jgi:hypothetical protein
MLLLIVHGMKQKIVPVLHCRFIMFDQDGSVSGTRLPTFMVPASDPNILPPPTVQATNCRYNASWAAYACANVCYRRYTA